MNLELLLVAAGFVLAWLELRRIRRKVETLEKALRTRNETLAATLSAARRHIRAISETKTPGSRLSNAKINWHK